MTAEALRSRPVKQLATMARQHGISGWHSMRKEQLIQAILAHTATATRPTSAAPRKRQTAATTVKNDVMTQARSDLLEMHRKSAALKSLASGEEKSCDPMREDSLVIMVRDPYWLHACWNISHRSIDRAQVAMGRRWHGCQPTLRVYRILEAGTSELERDIPIHGGVANWYVDVSNPPSSFRMEIGYLASDGVFYSLARSNTVLTPPPSSSASMDETWADIARNADMIYAMSGGYSPQGTSRELQEMLEERLRRPLGSPMRTRFGNGASSDSETSLELAVDAEVTIYGSTCRQAHVTLQGEPVQLRPDGTFSVRLKLSEMRQVIPVVASSGDGVEQRTVILALERNTKVLEPVIRDLSTRKSGH